MSVDIAEWNAAVRENSRALASAARAAGLEAAVPTCPDWTVADLVGHMTGVHRWVRAIIETRAQEFPGWSQGGVEGDPVDAFEAGAAALSTVLEATDPEVIVWNFGVDSPGPVRFWDRRMACEIMIHRVDAAVAGGSAVGAEQPELAADGLDEMFGLFPARIVRDKRLQAVEGNFHFHTTDTPGEWVVDFAAGKVEVRREHAKSAVAVRGPAWPLLLFAYGRGPADELEILGDAGLIGAWREGVRF
jgi:uncharacterized protein (TIGR03083 family)